VGNGFISLQKCGSGGRLSALGLSEVIGFPIRWHRGEDTKIGIELMMEPFATMYQLEHFESHTLDKLYFEKSSTTCSILSD
jgi:hypothetical protein